MSTRKVTVITGPALEPVTLAEAKLWCKVDLTTDDDLIEDVLIPAARALVEDIIDQCIQTQTLELCLDEWPDGPILLPKGPLQSVTSIKYKDSDGLETTWGASNYIVDTDSRPGRVVLAWGCSYPSFSMYPSNPIRVRYVAGTQDASPTVPVSHKIKLAMRLLISHWYQNRETVLVGSISKELEFAVKALLGNTTIYSF